MRPLPEKPTGARTWQAAALAALLLVSACAQKKTAPSSEAERGPHGGRLLRSGKLAVEVTIYERGVPPQFRIYGFENDKPLAPTEFTASVELVRHGNRVEQISFKPDEDYLVGDKVVEEPHSFDVKVTAGRGGQAHALAYSQREGRVVLTADAVRTSEITIEKAGPRTMRSVVELPGELLFNGDKVTHVVPRVAGVLREIRKNQGDEVKKGEVLAVLDSRELAEAKRGFLETAHEQSFAKRAFEREEGLWKKNIASEVDYLKREREFQEARLKHQSARQQLEALGLVGGTLKALLDKENSSLTRLELRAPFDGVVIEKTIAVGQAVKEDEDLFTIADLSTLWVSVTVFAKDLNAVKVGQDVTVKAEQLGLEAQGKIVYLGALVGEQTRSAKARVVLADPERKWRAGLFVTVTVVQNEATVPVVVKREGLQKFRDWDVVFVRFKDEFEARPLELGREDGEWVEVVSGLKAGEEYAAANSFILKADVGKAGASHDH